MVPNAPDSRARTAARLSAPGDTTPSAAICSRRARQSAAAPAAEISPVRQVTASATGRPASGQPGTARNAATPDRPTASRQWPPARPGPAGIHGQPVQAVHHRERRIARGCADGAGPASSMAVSARRAAPASSTSRCAPQRWRAIARTTAAPPRTRSHPQAPRRGPTGRAFPLAGRAPWPPPSKELLPIPAGPVTASTPPLPARAPASRASIRPSSPSRSNRPSRIDYPVLPATGELILDPIRPRGTGGLLFHTGGIEVFITKLWPSLYRAQWQRSLRARHLSVVARGGAVSGRLRRPR